MNFFGHAVLAARGGNNAPFVLGAMLPDLAAMVGSKVPAVRGAELDAGVRFHYLTDHAFHDSAVFRALSSRAFEQLTALGVARGPARAVAHVGIELLLDAALSEVAPEGLSAYRAALRAAPRLKRSIEWPARRQGLRFSFLCRTLRNRPPAARDAEPTVLSERLDRLLAGRPRLRLGSGDVARVALWSRGARSGVFHAAEGLLDDLLHALAPVSRDSGTAAG